MTSARARHTGNMKSQPLAHIACMARQMFGIDTFQSWNSGSYHDDYHAMYVAEVISAMAARRLRDPERRLFLTQAALLHDADPRPAHLATPASVHRTLEWMLRHRDGLQAQLCWTDLAFDTALALIARTDFPFDDKPRKSATRFAAMSPYQVYRELLGKLPAESRERTFEDAQMLRFADQCANYCRDYATASRSVDDLSLEMHNNGIAMTRWDLDTPRFLDALASDAHWDQRMASELGLRARVFSGVELRQSLTPAMQLNIERNRELFQRERDAREATG